MKTETDKPDLSALRISRETVEPRREKKIPWKVLAPFALILIAVAVYLVYRGGFAKVPEVEVATASLTFPSQANAILTASGYVVAQQKAAVASKATGRLVFLGVEEGDRVKKGQVIARIEDNDVRAALGKAKADLDFSVADLEDAQRALERQKTLFSSGLTSAAELDGAQARFRRVQASIRSGEAAVKGAEVALENTRIRAPFDGTVLTKDADVGEVVAPFGAAANARGAVVSMADMTSLDVEADVSESNIPRVKVGQPCEIVLDAYPEKNYEGFVHKIVPTADRAKATVLTKVRFKNRDERVLPEMSAKVTFLSKAIEGSSADASPKLTVPGSSVVTRDGREVVLLVRESKAIEIPVVTGARLGARIEIKQGLVAGDQVILRPDAGVTDGTKVKSKS